MNARDKTAALLLFTPVLAALLLMAPRLADPHFGFFDDTSTLQTADDFLRGNWDAVMEGYRGRSRPMYWLLYTVIYAAAGKNAAWFFVGNTVVLCLIVAGVILLARSVGAARREAWIAGMVFVLSGPVLENVYTLSKPELQQLLWMVAALGMARVAERSSGRRRFASIGLAALAVTAACATKETAVLLLPISVLWLMVGWAARRLRAGGESGFLRDPALALACLAGVALYLGLSAIYVSAARLQGGYGSSFDFSAGRLIANARVWADWLNRDYLFLLPLTALGLLRLRALRPRLAELAMWGIWIAVWLAVYLPWVFTPEYYLLPLSVGTAMVAGILASLALDLAAGPVRTWRLAATATLALSIFLWFLTLPNLYTNGRFQLAIDSANAEMVAYLAENMPGDGVVLVNLPPDGEYAGRFPGILESIGGRADLTAGVLSEEDPRDRAWAGRTIALALPVYQNEFFPSVRVGFHQQTAVHLNEAAREYVGGLTPAHRAIRSFRLFAADAARIFCPLAPQLAYCAFPNTPFDRRLLTYGWEIFVLPRE